MSVGDQIPLPHPPARRFTNDTIVAASAKNSVVGTGAEREIVTLVCSLARLIFYKSGMLREGRHA